MLLIKEELNKSGIYKIICLHNNKFYIGSAVNIYHRFHIHLYNLRKNNHSNKYLQNIYNKYGFDNFKFEIVEEVDNRSNLIEREQFYLDLLKPELNILKIAGSCLGLKKSEESKIKQSLKIKDRKQSEEHVRKRFLNPKKRDFSSRILAPNFIKGYKRKKESVEKQIVTRSKPIFKLDNNLNIIQEFKSIKEAKIITGKNNICSYLKGRYNDNEGFIWKYKNNYLSLKIVDNVRLEEIKLNEVNL